jgi:hypothetical protein
VIADPPVFGAVQLTVAESAAPLAVGFVGAAGTSVSPHLVARYSSTARRCAVVAAALRTMISPMSLAGV